MKKLLGLLVVLVLLVAACGGDDAADVTTTAGTDTTAAASSGDTDTTETTVAETTTTTVAETTTTAATTETDAPALSDSPLLAALSQGGEVTSARMEGAITMSGMEGTDPGTEFSITFSGEFAENGDNSIVMDMSGIADAAPAGEEIPAGFEDLFSEMEIRTIGDTAYMKFGFFSILGVTTDWVSMSAEEAGSTAGSFGIAPTDPSEIMGAFDGPGSEIEEVGNETVRGVPTTHYRITVDSEAMLAEADPEELAELESLGVLTGEGTFPVDFWIGEDGLVYRMEMVVAGADFGESALESMSMVWEMYDYGANIVVEAPPAADVTDGMDLGGFLTG